MPSNQVPARYTDGSLPAKKRSSSTIDLKLTDILDRKTCPPISLDDFRLYLLHKERSIENLQFYVWYEDYKRRFNALPPDQQALSPPPQRHWHVSNHSSNSSSSGSSNVPSDPARQMDAQPTDSKDLQQQHVSGDSVMIHIDEPNAHKIVSLEENEELRSRPGALFNIAAIQQHLPPDLELGNAPGNAQQEHHQEHAHGHRHRHHDPLQNPHVALRHPQQHNNEAINIDLKCENCQMGNVRITGIQHHNPRHGATSPVGQCASCGGSAPNSPSPSANPPSPSVQRPVAVRSPSGHSQQHHHHGQASGATCQTCNASLPIDFSVQCRNCRMGNVRIVGIEARPPPPLMSPPISPPPLSPGISSETRTRTRLAQPFRPEVDVILRLFFSPDSPRELNIDAPTRRLILANANLTTHPDVFAPAANHVFDIMQYCSLPGFLRFAMENINPPKKIFWMTVGCVDFLIGVLAVLLCLFLDANRAYRLFAAPFVWFGTSQFYSGTQGLCTQVLGREARQLRPWELIDAADLQIAAGQVDKDAGSLTDDDSSQSGLRRRRAGSLAAPWMEEDQWDPLNDSFIVDPTKRSPPSTGNKIRRGTKAGKARKQKDVKVAIFGEEAKVADPLILQLQKALMIKVLLVGTITMFIFVGAAMALPNIKLG